MSKTIIKRLRLFLAFTVLIMVVLGFRLAQLQIIHGHEYQKRSEENMLRVLPITAPRGDIYDAGGVTLVSNRTGFTVSLGEIPSSERERVIQYLSEILELDVEEIQREIDKQRFRRYQPVKLKTDVDMVTIARIEERRLELPGVIIEVEPIRSYMDGRLAPHIIGNMFMGSDLPHESEIERWASQGYVYRLGDDIGRFGIERGWEPYLRGERGELLVEVNAWGRLVGVRGRKDPVPGNDLHLTLDAKLQMDTQRLIEESLESLRENFGYNPRGASVVVLDPNTGGILAMASYPDFDLITYTNREYYNEIITDPLKPITNRAISGYYAGGSTFKMVTATAALEEGRVTPGETFRCTGSLTRYGNTRRCLGVHGPTNLYRAIVRSCNVYFYEMGLRAGIDKLAYYSEEYGFGQRTGLTDVSGEKSGTVASRDAKLASSLEFKTWVPGDTMSAAIGQGFHEFTPLQLANYSAIIANGGYRYRPYLVDKAVSYEGEVVWQTKPEYEEVNISDRTFQLLQSAMEGVCQPGGTAGFMGRLPVKVAGKTGSVEHGIRGREPHGAFVGYAPAENPEIAFAVVIEFGGSAFRSAAPLAQKIVESYFGLLEEEEPEESEEFEDAEGILEDEGNGVTGIEQTG